MSWFKRLLLRRRLYVELSEEIREHLEEKIEELVASGMPKQEAAHVARREFGNVELVKESAHEVWGWMWLEDVIEDLRFGIRMLRKSPGLTVVAVLMTALGIAANVSVFSFVDGLFLTKPDFPLKFTTIQGRTRGWKLSAST